MNEPIQFEPLYMERVWGGRQLDVLLGRRLPQGAPIGESWEIVDREEAQSVVHDGPLRGVTLHQLWTEQRDQIFGRVPESPRFPLLVKLLDAREALSVQVHPPARIAPSLGGEPKTEMWYFLHADPNAVIYAGLRERVSAQQFETALESGTVETLIHELPVRTGESIFIPSGRLHAIGGGNVIIEIQQNSDTTYRVYDWGRLGLDGKPRALHIQESLASIDFDDLNPKITPSKEHQLAACPHFKVEKITLTKPLALALHGSFAIISVAAESLSCAGKTFRTGDNFLLPASMGTAHLEPSGNGQTVFLHTTLPLS